MLIVGDREEEAEQVAVREHGRGDVGSTSIGDFIDRVRELVESRANL